MSGTHYPDYLEGLARFVAATPPEAIPRRVLDRAKVLIADTLAVAAAGMRAVELSALADRQLGSGRGGPCWVIGTGRTADPLDAAMLNGVAGAWLDFDEGNFRANGHPGIQVLPAALATAQALRRSGRELLAAFVLGYEVVARIGAATTMRLIVNPHGTYGVVGAALSTARLAGLEPARFRELASLAASCCMATNRHTMLNGATVRNWYAGHSATMGQMAVRLIESGFTAPADGVRTTFSLVLGDGFDPAVAVDGLGERWMLTDGYVKLVPTARYAHSAIDAFLDAVARAPAGAIRPETIERVEIRAYRLAAFLKEKRVTSWFGTRFSIPFACATLLVGGRAMLDAFGDAAVADETVQRLAQRVDVVEDAALEASYPARQEVIATIHTRDGAAYHGRCDITSGEPQRPHPPGAEARKFRELSDPVWGEARAARLYDAVMTLDAAPDAADLLDFKP
jgi:2-methylcitrate dehydratase PrpD